MTYREKLQKEHPECVDECYYGGCSGCPNGYGYGPESCLGKACLGYSKETCTKCWDTVIPGTEDKQYENWTRDELMRLIRNYEVRDDAHEKRHEADRKEIELLKEESEIKFQAKDNIIDNLEKRNEELEQKIETYSRICNILKSKDTIIEKQEKEIKALKGNVNALAVENTVLAEKVEERDQKIQKLEGACSAKNAEIVRLENENNILKDIVKDRNERVAKLTKKLDEEKTRKYFWCEDNCCAMVKDKEIKELKEKNEELQTRNDRQGRTIIDLKKRLNSVFGKKPLERTMSGIETFATRKEAEQLICDMGNLIDLYGACTIADLKDIRAKDTNYLERQHDQQYGWVSVKDAEVVKLREGYIVMLPRETLLY